MFTGRTNWRTEPNLLATALERHRRSGQALIDLTASNPTLCGFDYPAREILSSLADPRGLIYSPESKGLSAARLAVAGYYSGRPAFAAARAPVDSDRVILLSGTSEAYSHLFRLLCEPGDEVLAPAPSYPLFEFLADLNDIRLVAYPLVYDHGWQLDFHALRRACTARSRAVMVVHPNNPTGSFVKPAEAAELLRICAGNGMAVIADEVFLDYAASGAAVPSFALGGPALAFTLSGLSKICALPQMKLAWIVASGPGGLVRPALERLEIIADTYLSPATPVQLAAVELLALRAEMQPQIRRRVAANLASLDRELCRKASPLTRLETEGGWYAVLRVPSAGSDEELAVQLLEQFSVLVHPGRFFNFANDGFFVLSLTGPETDFREGCLRLRHFFP